VTEPQPCLAVEEVEASEVPRDATFSLRHRDTEQVHHSVAYADQVIANELGRWSREVAHCRPRLPLATLPAMHADCPFLRSGTRSTGLFMQQFTR